MDLMYNLHDLVEQSAAPPCPTLFVANLGPNCSEQELTQVFSRFEGIPCAIL